MPELKYRINQYKYNKSCLLQGLRVQHTFYEADCSLQAVIKKRNKTENINVKYALHK